MQAAHHGLGVRVRASVVLDAGAGFVLYDHGRQARCLLQQSEPVCRARYRRPYRDAFSDAVCKDAFLVRVQLGETPRIAAGHRDLEVETRSFTEEDEGPADETLLWPATDDDPLRPVTNVVWVYDTTDDTWHEPENAGAEESSP